MVGAETVVRGIVANVYYFAGMEMAMRRTAIEGLAMRRMAIMYKCY